MKDKMNSIRKKLIRNLEFNPFHDKFNVEKVQKEIVKFSEKKSDNETSMMVATLNVAIVLNNSFVLGYESLKKNLFNSNLNAREIMSFSISCLNRQGFVLRDMLLDKLAQTNEQHFEDSFNFKIKSSDPTISDLNAGGAMESTLDGMNILLSYLKYFVNDLGEKDKKIEEIKSVNSIISLQIISTAYYVLKAEWEQCVWNNGYATYDKAENRIDFKYTDHDTLKLKKAGLFRFHRNVFSYFMVGKQMIDSSETKIDFLKENYKQFKKAKRIKSVDVKDGEVKYKLASGIDRLELIEEVKSDSEFLLYYNFISNVKLPNFNDLTLDDVILLFDVLQHLITRVALIKIDDDSVYKLNDFGKFPFKIKKQDLVNYLLNRTNYKSIQVHQFLNLLTNPKDKRIDFWKYPFILEGDMLYFPVLTLKDPISIVLADRWLEDGGFDLIERGHFFEKHIKDRLATTLKAKGYEYKIPNISVFKLQDNTNKEEIDLILNLKSICIIAELKCIKFPMSPRDEHNSLNRLKDGVEQVKRKSKFIIDNSIYFKDKIGDVQGKQIVNLVITNYPTFSGISIDGIPIVDDFLFDSYITSGVFTNYKRTSNNGKLINDEIVSELKMYNNEIEFCANFLDCMSKPHAIKIIKDELEVKSRKSTYDFTQLDIYVESADFKNNKC